MDPHAKLRELERQLLELGSQRDAIAERIKLELLAGAEVEPGPRMCWLELLPGRARGSNNPNDYVLRVEDLPEKPQ